MSLKAWNAIFAKELLWLSDPDKWGNRFDEHLARQILYQRHKHNHPTQQFLVGIVKGARDIWREERARRGHNKG